ncbi:MAG: DUF2490 domain-containing protein [Pyrinomonadaceae bacterium]
MKIKSPLISICFILFLSALSFAQSADDNSDIVGWSDITVGTPLIQKEENGKKVDKLALSFTSALRFGRNLKRPIDERAGLALTYRFNKYFSAGSGYLYRRFRPTEAPRQYEHRILFFLLAEKQWKNVVVRNRSLTTYLIKHSRPDTVVYRNRLQANFPVRKNEKVLFSPFVADEPFYDFRVKKWVRNDIYAGITRQFTKRVAADFFYIHQGFKLGSLRKTNGFGVSFRYRVDKLIKLN